MTMDLERELEAAMRAHVTGARLSPDVLLAAARAHRRRRSARRAAMAAGGLTLAAAVAGIVVMNPGATTNGSSTPGPSAPQSVQLQPASYIASHVTEALDRNGTTITYVTTHDSTNGETRDEEQWWDGATGDWRRHAPNADALIKYTGDRATFTVVDHTTRTWWAITYQADTTTGWSKDDIKAALKNEGSFTVVGQESLHGRDVIRLRVARSPKGGSDLQLWVDAKTYDLVRTVDTYTPSGGAPASVSTWDYTYLPRNPAELRRFTLEPPADYTRDQSGAPQKSNAEPAN